MGDFFDMTVGRIMGSSRARVRLKPGARALILEKCGCTEEELDAALDELGRQTTAIVHADMKVLRQKTIRSRAKQLLGLIAKKKGEHNGPDGK